MSIGEQTRRLVEGYFNLRTLTPVVVKGVADPVAVYEVIGIGRLRRHSQIAARRDLSKFAGRSAELRQMRHAFDRALGGRGQIVSLVAGPGLGKSRLLMEFSRDLPLAAKIVEAHAASYSRRTPWLPVLSMLQDYFAFSDTDRPADRRAKIDAALATLDVERDETRLLLFTMLGIVDGPDELRQMDPAVRRQRTITALVDILRADSQVQPVIVIVEDLHWIDDQSKALLDQLAKTIITDQILLLVTARPEYVPTWTVGLNVTEIILQPLSAEISSQLVASLLSDDPELASLNLHIQDRTGGNPLFMEEIVNALFEDGTLARFPVRLARPLSEINIPMTIRGVLLERIDQLPARQKDLLQILSVLGQTLPLDLIFELVPWPRADTEWLVENLQTAGFIYAQADVRPGSNWVNYVFKHALTQEAAYRSLLAARRQALHKSAAVAIQRIYAESLEDVISLLAHHYSAAEEHLKAIEYLGRAGEQAVRRSAHVDAVGFFREALRRVELIPAGAVPTAQTGKLCLGLAKSLLVANGYAHAEVRSAYSRARDLSSAAGDEVSLALVLRGTSQIHLSRADYAPELEAGRDLLKLGARDESCRVEGNIALAIGSTYTGRLQDAERFFVDAMRPLPQKLSLAKFQDTGHSDTLCRAYYALCIAYLGKIDLALAESQSAVLAAEKLSIPITTAQTLSARGTTLHRLRYYDAAQSCYDQALACTAKHGLPYWDAFCSMSRAALAAVHDGPEAALETFERSRAAYQGTGARLIMSWFLYLRAGLLARAGRLTDACACIDETLAFIAESGETLFEAEVLRFRGALLLRRQGIAADAEACFLGSLEIAREQGAKLWELRTATSLASLRIWQHRRHDALQTLARVYASFTEGFAAPDLVDARGLLDTLAAVAPSPLPPSSDTGTALLDL